jgi:phage FluMu protein Com
MEEKKIDIRCPLCKALLMKIIKCLSGEKYIEVKCRKCREIVLVP